jgi:hypothetical protein
MPTFEEWRAIWDGTIEEAERDRLVAEACTVFDELLGRGSEVGHEIERVFAERLAGTITTDTWDPIDRFLSLYADVDVKYLISWTALSPEDRLPIIERLGPPRTSLFLRTLVARNTPAIADAWNAWNELPDNWRNLNRSLVLDSDRGKLCTISITTYGGALLRIECPLSSLMGLTRYFLETLMESELAEYGSPAVDRFLATLSSTTTWATAERAGDIGIGQRADPAGSGITA